MLVTYHMPSAYDVSGSDNYFNYLPVPETLEETRREASNKQRSHGIRIDGLQCPFGTRRIDQAGELEDYFGPITEAAGGKILFVRPGDDVDTSVTNRDDESAMTKAPKHRQRVSVIERRIGPLSRTILASRQ